MKSSAVYSRTSSAGRPSPSLSLDPSAKSRKTLNDGQQLYFACLRTLFLLVAVMLMLARYRLAQEGLAVDSPPEILEEPALFPSETFLVHVPSQISSYQNTFNHPWHLLQLTRHCNLPHQCSFLSVDLKFNRYFYQHNKEHVWVDPGELQPLLDRVNLTLRNDNNEFVAGSNDAVITGRRQPVFGDPLDNSDSLETVSSLIGQFTHEPSVARIVHHRKARTRDLQFNFITNAYRDVRDFRDRVKRGLRDSGIKDFSSKLPVILAFLPNCSAISPSHFKYMQRHIELIELNMLQVYSGCLSKEFPFEKATSDDKKLRHAGKYRWTLVWETSNYLSESFFRALAYDSLPIVYYDGDDLINYLPDPEAAIDILGKGLAGREAQVLVDLLKGQSEADWKRAVSWKERDSLSDTFQGLFQWNLESLVCRLCRL